MKKSKKLLVSLVFVIIFMKNAVKMMKKQLQIPEFRIQGNTS